MALALAGIFASAFFLMILVGVAHSEWLTVMPTMGYAVAVKITTVMFLAKFVSELAANIIKQSTEN